VASLKKHRRQWFISMDQAPGVLDRLPDFRTRKLADRLYLHHDSDLRLSSHDWPDGTQSLVLGTIIDEPSGPDSLHCNMGRFVAITSNWLSLDATGSMGVFYFIDPQDIVCSSSAALTAEISGLPLVGRELQSSETQHRGWNNGGRTTFGIGSSNHRRRERAACRRTHGYS
jgi:hypothetical protein